jgi:predicted DNA-binding transcriptional regulator YafY
MKRAERLIDLMHLLGGRRRVTIGDIANRFEVSERTAYRDLADLGSGLAPVVRDEGGYRLMDGAKLQPQTLTLSERRLLTVLLDCPALSRLPSLSARLRSLADKLAPENAAAIAEGDLQFAEIDRSGRIEPQSIRRLESAIDARTSVRIDYASLSSATRRWRAVDPLAIFHRAQAWYLVARCHESGQPRMFRLDRVMAVETSNGSRFEPPKDFALDQFLAGSWEVFRGEETFDVVIRFNPALAPLVLHGYHHPGEKVEARPDGGAEYRVTLSHLDEIARWVVGFAGGAVAVEPAELVARVVEIAEGARAVHQGEIGASQRKRERRTAKK